MLETRGEMSFSSFSLYFEYILAHHTWFIWLRGADLPEDGAQPVCPQLGWDLTDVIPPYVVVVGGLDGFIGVSKKNPRN